MRFATDGRIWDRLLPAFVLPCALWTAYVHVIVAAQASFTTLVRGLPVLAVVAVAATVGWFRLREPAAAGDAGRGGIPGTVPGRLWPVSVAALAFAVLWVGLLSWGLPYPLAWWIGLAAMGAAWQWTLRHGPRAAGEPDRSDRSLPVETGVVACIVVAAICVVLFSNRPDADDAYHVSVSATLLRLPQAPVLLHDTMYRLPDAPILLPFYRLANYDVLIGAAARATGIDHLVVAYALLPAMFAALSILAWVFLLRRLVPARWPVVLAILFACVMALGEVHRAYGNFAFVRMFQGKSVLATCMVPAIAGAALLYARHGGLRHWFLLLATQVAAIGCAASGMFVAPAAAALGLAGGWWPDLARTRRFLLGMLATGYPVGAAMLVARETRGAQVLSISSPIPMPTIPELLADTWGPWSMRILLVSLLAAWAFVRDPARARYFSAGAFFFLLVALNPYTTPFVAEHYVGAQTYWRLTWALPLPFFLAVTIDGIAALLLRLESKALAACCCLVLVAGALTFGWRHGTLRRANAVTLGKPGPKVPPLEFAVARQVVEEVPEQGVVVAPEQIATWLPVFAVHPETVGVRHMYLSLVFTPAETAQRSNMMRYVSGDYRPPDGDRWFEASLARYRVSAVVFARVAPWRDEIERVLEARGFRALACGTYAIYLQGDASSLPADAASLRCGEAPVPVGR